MDFSFSIQLKQHTPLIHFQHDQAGATLRATEVKAKLDKYLIIHAFNSNEDLYKQYKIGGADSAHPALDYKIKIIPTGNVRKNNLIEKGSHKTPMFFGNMGDDYHDNPKGLKQYAGADLIFYSHHEQLRKKIKNHISGFLAQTNFGMRQSKGYGSFTFGDYDFSNNFYHFYVEGGDIKKLFENIDLFYKSLRGGINAYRQNRVTKEQEHYFYMKPMIFQYASSKNIQWEKKTIKESINSFKGKLKIQQNNHSRHIPPSEQKDWPLWSIGDKKIVRDMLGLSTEQSWLKYGSDGKAKVTKVNTDDNGTEISDSDAIGRFASPILFKPVYIENENRFIVHFRAMNIPDEYRSAHFVIKADGVQTAPLPMWRDFNLAAFLEFAFEEGRLESSMRYNRDDGQAKGVADMLINIYNDIRSNC
ncbi:MAG: hypothetical protein JNK77_01010 [Saprospiraceae bacterium]|nr:hypothetical protein [Saprospiraceae bacterium]